MRVKNLARRETWERRSRGLIFARPYSRDRKDAQFFAVLQDCAERIKFGNVVPIHLVLYQLEPGSFPWFDNGSRDRLIRSSRSVKRAHMYTQQRSWYVNYYVSSQPCDAPWCYDCHPRWTAAQRPTSTCQISVLETVAPQQSPAVHSQPAKTVTLLPKAK